VVGESPEAIAIDGQYGQTTYEQLAETVETAAAALRRAGLGPAALVRIAGPAGPAQVSNLLAAWRCGAVTWLEESPGTDGEVQVDGWETAPADIAAAVQDLASHKRDEVLAAGGGYLVRSSGSTGRRKLILGSYRSLSAFVAWQRAEFGVAAPDRIAAVTYTGFDVVYRELLVAVTSGATLVCPPPRPRPSAMLAWMAQTRCTVVHMVPSIARFWLTVTPDDAVARPDLRVTFFAGEPLDGGLTGRWWTRTGTKQMVLNLYGPSETTLAKFCYRVPRSARRRLPVGSPLPGTTVAITDPRTGTALPDGEVGEVVITTRDGTLGYLGFLPEAAAGRLEIGPQSVTFRTGDLGRLQPEGLMLLGRVDSRLKINGMWVDPHDIERVLREHEGVDDAAVITVRVGGQTRLNAFVATRLNPPASQLRSHVLHCLGTHSVPTRITTIPHLPRLSTGKVDRLGLLAMARSDQESEESTVDDTVEVLIKRIREVIGSALGVEVPADADMLEHGLDSLAALELCAVLEDELEIHCTLEEVFEHPVPRDLARLLHSRLTEAI